MGKALDKAGAYTTYDPYLFGGNRRRRGTRKGLTSPAPPIGVYLWDLGSPVFDMVGYGGVMGNMGYSRIQSDVVGYSWI